MRLHDTLSNELVALPDSDQPVKMYVCGPTVYQRAHIGNARPFVVFSLLRNWLAHEGRKVVFVHNITDVNDKIYDASPGGSATLALEATKWYVDDISRFGLGLPDLMPRVTDTMPEIIDLIDKLVSAGYAYSASGDVYFSVGSCPGYGRLANRVEDQNEDASPNPLKRSGRDFALWKKTKAGEDTSWRSPWGDGRPGWHIECSAMALKHLGGAFDIHGGGLDLVFPHHENEMAQSRAAGHRFADIWMHNGMLEFVGEKMSKSLGNVESIRDALDRWSSEVLISLFLSSHWRSPLEYSETALRSEAARLSAVRDQVMTAERRHAPDGEWGRVSEALNENFNTPLALSIVHEWADSGYIDLVTRFLSIFGLGTIASPPQAPLAVRALAEERSEARATRRYAEADRLRSAIAGLGWEARDRAGNESLLLPRIGPQPE